MRVDSWGWLSRLEPVARADWRGRLDWVASIDRLAQAEELDQCAESLGYHYLVPRSPQGLGVSWCEAWRRYVVAARRYYRPKAIVPDIAAHHEMLLELGGNIFCLLPEVDWSWRRSIAHLGALDRYFVQLRDVSLDARQARCHFPLDTLSSFGFAPQDLADRRCLSGPAYRELMHFWLDEYLPSLRCEAAEFNQAQGLPRALRLLRDECARRHGALERALREACFDIGRSPRATTRKSEAA